jgi:iron only hydrogenase large subunit-like protein
MVIRSRQSSTITETLPCRGGAVGGGRRYVGRRKKLQRKKIECRQSVKPSSVV